MLNVLLSRTTNFLGVVPFYVKLLVVQRPWNVSPCLPLAAAPEISIESGSDRVSVKAGALVLLSASVCGFPSPSLCWRHNGKAGLEQAANVKVDVNVDVTSVSIKGSVARNGGKYELVATNEVGEATAEFNVVVTGA